VTCVNLIPAGRRDAKARRIRLGYWTAGGILYALALLAGCMACHKVLGKTGADLTRDIDVARGRIRGTNQLILALCRQVSDLEWQLASARIVAHNPDWSVLLGVLASHLGDQVVLERCFLEPVKPAGAKPAAARPEEQFLLELSGLAQSQSAVSQFVLRLEKTRLFDEVKLIKTTRRPFVSGDVVSFRLQGSFDTRVGGVR